MFELFTIGFFGFVMYIVGGASYSATLHEKCETKYNYMQANKVTEHCAQLLKFEKTPEEVEKSK